MTIVLIMKSALPCPSLVLPLMLPPLPCTTNHLVLSTNYYGGNFNRPTRWIFHWVALQTIFLVVKFFAWRFWNGVSNYIVSTTWYVCVVKLPTVVRIVFLLCFWRFDQFENTLRDSAAFKNRPNILSSFCKPLEIN